MTNDVKISYRGREYTLAFNLNVMKRIQDEYGTVSKWGELTDGTDGKEPNLKAVIFGITEAINEGIDIANEEKGASDAPLSEKQVGRIITEIGLQAATEALHDSVIESTESAEKN